MPRLNRDPPTGGDDYVESDDPHRHAEMQWGHVTAHIYCLRTIPLRLLDVGVAKHQLDRPNIHTVREESTGSFVTYVPLLDGHAGDISSRGSRAQSRQWVPGSRWCASVRLASCRRSKRARGRVVCRCLEWPHAVSGFILSAATLTNRSGGEVLLLLPTGRAA
jgi:hypothetical protein